MTTAVPTPPRWTAVRGRPGAPGDAADRTWSLVAALVIFLGGALWLAGMARVDRPMTSTVVVLPAFLAVGLLLAAATSRLVPGTAVRGILATGLGLRMVGLWYRYREAADGLVIRRLIGAEITERHWDAFWRFYQDTGARKWGYPYLTRTFFRLIAERMPERILLIVAERDGEPIAGALNFIGGAALYGRYWGCTQDAPFLHFELCYHQAVEFAIERGLARVEAGAQGQHKIARGYEPVATWSAHWIVNESFRDAIARYLEAERSQMGMEIEALKEFTPFRKSS